MRKNHVHALILSASSLFAIPHQASAQTIYAQRPVQQVAYDGQSNLGGGFLEFLFTGGAQPQGAYQRRAYEVQQQPQQYGYAPQPQSYEPVSPAQPAMDPKFEKQAVEYPTKEMPGTIVIDTSAKFLYLVEGGGRAIRYGIGVGKPGFEWAGIKQVSRKREWPDWTPPDDMLRRRPDLPRHMEGGPENPLGARAMYLGSSLYRIHGSNEPWTIGTAVSSGCIRMRNEDVIDLYDRVKVGAKVIVS